jgi:hypothetical protein
MSDDAVSLAGLVGTNVFVTIPAFKRGQMTIVKLIGVEVGGIWIESDDLMAEMLAGLPITMTQRRARVFIPFAQLLAVYTFGGGPWISETIAK